MGWVASTTTKPTAGPQDLASGANVSSKGTHPVCRLPLAALRPWTSGVWPRRPAAVIQYEAQGPETRERACRLFIGASDLRGSFPGIPLLPCGVRVCALFPKPRDHQRGDYTALLGGGLTPPPVVPIHSPHEPASGGNENSPGGALPLGPACTPSEMSPSREICPNPSTAERCTCLPVCHSCGWASRDNAPCHGTPTGLRWSLLFGGLPSPGVGGLGLSHSPATEGGGR